MWLMIAATATGLVAGICFDLYYRGFPGSELVSAPIEGIEDVFAREAGIGNDHCHNV